MNKIMLIGTLAADPEMRYTQEGTPVTEFRIATNNGKDKDSDWHNIIVWGSKDREDGGQAGLAAQYLKKGHKVALTGRSHQQTWEKDGTKHFKTVVTCDMFGLEFLTSKREAEAIASS